MVVCKKFNFGEGEEAPLAPTTVVREQTRVEAPSSPARRFPKFITDVNEAYNVAKEVLREIGERESPDFGSMGGLKKLPSEVNGPWEMTKDAAKKTLRYIFNSIHHSCYMLVIINNKRELIKLEPEGIPESHKEKIESVMETSSDPRWNRFKDKELRMMGCVLKTRRDESSYSTQYNEWINKIDIPLPDGIFILNLTDAVIMRRDHKKPWAKVGAPVEFEQKYLPILGGSGSEACWDIPIPNYDDIMIALGHQKLDTFETSWGKKQKKAVFRGGWTGCGTTARTNMRIALAEMPPSADIDVKLVGKPSNNPRYDPERGWTFMESTAEPTEKRMSKAEQSRHKYIIHVDGNVAAYRLLEFMKMGSVIIKVQGGYRLWFEHLLEDKDSMVLVAPDVEHVKEAVEWCKKNDDRCKTIAERCKALADEMLNKEFMDETFARILWTLAGAEVTKSLSLKEPTPPPKEPTPPPAPVAKKALTIKEILAMKAAAKAKGQGQAGGRRTRKYTFYRRRRITRRR